MRAVVAADGFRSVWNERLNNPTPSPTNYAPLGTTKAFMRGNVVRTLVGFRNKGAKVKETVFSSCPMKKENKLDTVRE